MQLSRKKRRWVTLGVGIVGLVTIVGLSDLAFLIPQQQTNTQPIQEITPTDTTAPAVTATSTPLASTTPEDPNQFKL